MLFNLEIEGRNVSKRIESAWLSASQEYICCSVLVVIAVIRIMARLNSF
jgi:hypothetical protein